MIKTPPHKSSGGRTASPPWAVGTPGGLPGRRRPGVSLAPLHLQHAPHRGCSSGGARHDHAAARPGSARGAAPRMRNNSVLEGAGTRWGLLATGRGGGRCERRTGGERGGGQRASHHPGARGVNWKVKWEGHLTTTSSSAALLALRCETQPGPTTMQGARRRAPSLPTCGHPAGGWENRETHSCNPRGLHYD